MSYFMAFKLTIVLLILGVVVLVLFVRRWINPQ
jgi:hypothetical protein